MCERVQIEGQIVITQGQLAAMLGVPVGRLVRTYGKPDEDQCLCPIDIPATAKACGWRAGQACDGDWWFEGVAP